MTKCKLSLKYMYNQQYILQDYIFSCSHVIHFQCTNYSLYLIQAPKDEIQIMNVTESNTVVAVSGISLTLKCISVHQPSSNISWSSNGEIISQNQGNLTKCTYKFIPSEEDQNSIYRCTAVYIGKTIRKSVRLNLVHKSSGNIFVCMYFSFSFIAKLIIK